MQHDQRREPRRRCRIEAEIRSGERRFKGEVVDLSRSGICVAVSPYCDLDRGCEVDVYSAELGLLQGRTKWRTTDRLGIAFPSSSNTSAKLASYTRMFRGELV